jgi:hypothetical protein
MLIAYHAPTSPMASPMVSPRQEAQRLSPRPNAHHANPNSGNRSKGHHSGGTAEVTDFVESDSDDSGRSHAKHHKKGIKSHDHHNHGKGNNHHGHHGIVSPRSAVDAEAAMIVKYSHFKPLSDQGHPSPNNSSNAHHNTAPASQFSPRNHSGGQGGHQSPMVSPRPQSRGITSPASVAGGANSRPSSRGIVSPRTTIGTGVGFDTAAKSGYESNFYADQLKEMDSTLLRIARANDDAANGTNKGTARILQPSKGTNISGMGLLGNGTKNLI